MSTLSEKLEDLRNALIIRSIFYIPETVKSLVGEEIRTKHLQSEEILYFNSSVDFVIFNNEHYLDIISKPKILEINCLKLLDFQQELNAQSFLYFAEKYLKTLEEYSVIAKELLKNYDLQSPDKTLKWKNLFVKQDNYFTEHLNEVQKITGLVAKILPKYQSDKYSFSINNNQYREGGTSSLRLFRSLAFANIDSENADSVRYKNKNRIEENHKKEIKMIKPFIAYFTHDKKEKILEIVKDKLGDINGKQLRFLMEYFIMQGILSIDNFSEFHRQLQVFFDEHQIAVYNSIFAKKIFYQNDTKFKEKVIYFNNVFKDVLIPLDLYK